jgi:hypothetical protein
MSTRENRARRRASSAAFRKDLRDHSVITFLVAGDDSAAFAKMPLLSRAASWWRIGGSCKCAVCKAPLDEPAGWLFALSPSSTAAVVWGFCPAPTCWGLEPEAMDAQAVKLLRRLLPGGRFIDPGAPE